MQRLALVAAALIVAFNVSTASAGGGGKHHQSRSETDLREQERKGDRDERKVKSEKAAEPAAEKQKGDQKPAEK